MDERDIVLARKRRELATFGVRHEPGELEVAGVNAKDRAGPFADRVGVVASVRAIRRSDLDELCTGTPQDIRDAEPAADLDELATRDDDLLARRQSREREQDGGRVVVHDHGVLGTREISEHASGVAVTLAALADCEVVFDADRSRRIGHRRERAR